MAGPVRRIAPMNLRDILLPAVPRPIAWTVSILAAVALVLLVIDPGRLLWYAVAVLVVAGVLLYGTAAYRRWKG